MKSKSKRESHHKAETHLRLTCYELQRARKIADKMKMKPTEYFEHILQDANNFYSGEFPVFRELFGVRD